MSYKQAYRDIMRIYESDRDQAAAVLKKRREEVYSRLPRIQEIDFELSRLGISAARQILVKNADSSTLLNDLHAKSATLKEEKEKILSNDGVPKEYFTDIYKCSLCKDTGYKDIGYKNTGYKNTGYAYASADSLADSSASAPGRCICLNQRLINKYYDLSNLKGLLESENFDNFDLRYYSESVSQTEGLSPRRNMEVIYKIATDFVYNFENSFQNLLFYGDTGLGKTFICNCIAKDLLDTGRSVLYVTAPRIFKLVEDYRFKRFDRLDETDSPDYAIDAVTDVDLLILDDLGAEFSTIVTSSALFDIINERLLAKKHTVISTNLPPQEIEAQYSDRIVSRFLGHYKMSKFFGDDIRAKKKYEGG